MKTLMIVIAMCVATTASMFATGQYPDKIVYEGREYSLLTNPMESYFAKHPDKKPKGGITSTALWRGYVATFEFKTNGLVLKDIEIEIRNETQDGNHDTAWKSVKADVVPQGETLRVDWFTGILVLPYGKLVNYVHMGYGSTYSNYILLEVREGRLTGTRTFDRKQYEAFKERQFQAYKKTADYKTRVKELSRDEWPQDNIDSFLRSYIVTYTSRFLDNEEQKTGSASNAMDSGKK